MFQRRDYIGAALGQALNQLGGAWGQKMAKDRQMEDSQNILNQLLNQKDTVTTDQQTQEVPRSPFDMQNIPQLAKLMSTNPQMVELLSKVYQANQPSYFAAPAGSGIYSKSPSGVKQVGQVPPNLSQQKSLSFTNATIDENGKPMEYSIGRDPITGQEKSRIPLGPAWVKPSVTAGNKPSWKPVKNALGATIKYIDVNDPSGKHVLDLKKDFGIDVQNPVSGTSKTMIETAPKVQELAQHVIDGIEGLKGDLGPASGRWSQFWAGSVGASKPEYNQLRVDAGLLSTLLMRMHVGARGSEKIMEKFDNLIGFGHQSPENLRVAMEAIVDYARAVENQKIGLSNSTGEKASSVENQAWVTMTKPDGTKVEVHPDDIEAAKKKGYK